MFKNSTLSRQKIGKIIECFCITIETSKTVLLLKLTRKIVDWHLEAFWRLFYLRQAS